MARAGRPRHGSAGTAPAPSLTLSRRGREPGSSPGGGGGGGGPARGERCSPQAPGAWRTSPAATGPGARAGRPRHSSAGTAPAPSLTLSRRGREPGSSPQRGEAGRGAARGEGYSPQAPGAWRTSPAATGPGARAACPRHGSAGTAPAPSLTLSRRGREPGPSPQRGEAGRGAARGEGCSPQAPGAWRTSPAATGPGARPGPRRRLARGSRYARRRPSR